MENRMKTGWRICVSVIYAQENDFKSLHMHSEFSQGELEIISAVTWMFCYIWERIRRIFLPWGLCDNFRPIHENQKRKYRLLLAFWLLGLLGVSFNCQHQIRSICFIFLWPRIFSLAFYLKQSLWKLYGISTSMVIDSDIQLKTKQANVCNEILKLHTSKHTAGFKILLPSVKASGEKRKSIFYIFVFRQMRLLDIIFKNSDVNYMNLCYEMWRRRGKVCWWCRHMSSVSIRWTRVCGHDGFKREISSFHSSAAVCLHYSAFIDSVLFTELNT